jgi:FimV-like protein
MNQGLVNIFNNSTCLTRKQVKEYVSGNMSSEEVHATEVHLLSCQLCSDAVEGMLAKNEGAVLETMMELDSEFLVPHFPLHDPQVHLNSIAPVEPVAVSYTLPNKKQKLPVWKRPAMVGSLLLAIMAIWFYQYGMPADSSAQQQQNLPVVTQEQPRHNQGKQEIKEVKASPVLSSLPQEDIAAAKQSSNNSNNRVSNNDNPQKPQPLIITDRKKAEETGKKESEETKDDREHAIVENETPKQVPVAATTPEKKIAPKKDSLPPASVPKPIESKILVNNIDEQVNSEKATISTARTYIRQGENDKAKEVLAEIAEDGSGAQKRKAKRLLRDLDASNEQQ